MPTQDDIVTLRLEGRVPFSHFATAINALDGLLKSLSTEITGSPATVQWNIVELSASSAVTTIQGTADDPMDIPPITTAYALVGQALADRSEIPYSEEIRRHANSIASLVNDEIVAYTLQYAKSAVRRPGAARTPRETRCRRWVWGYRRTYTDAF